MITLEENKQWFKEAKMGMMIHWGLYSLLAGEYRGQRMGDMIGEWAQSYFRIPCKEYEKLAELSEEQWTEENIKRMIFEKYPYPYLLLEAMTAKELNTQKYNLIKFFDGRNH